MRLSPAHFLALAAAATCLLAQEDRRGLEHGRAPRRLALVVGVNGYPTVPLKNPINDARSMEAVLRDLDFEVDVRTEVSFSQLKSSISQFAAKLRRGDETLFYFAGHGFQLNGDNYLVPLDFVARSAAEAEENALRASFVQSSLEAREPRVSVLIFDACRNNPFSGERSGGRGLAAMLPRVGTYIALAAAPGQTADDNPSAKNGLFTSALVEVLKRPGMSVDDVFTEVRANVLAASKGRQTPSSESRLTVRYVLRELAREERKLAQQQAEKQAQIARLEADLTELGRRREEAMTAEAQRQAKVQAAEAERTLRLQRLEQEQLKMAAERRERQQREEEQAAKQEVARRAEQEKLAAASAARLEALRRQVTQEQTDLGLSGQKFRTVDEIVREVTRLRGRKQEIEAAIFAERDRALRQLESEHEKARQPYLTIPTKDLFETTTAYQERITRWNSDKQQMESNQDRERREVRRRSSDQAATATQGLDREISRFAAGRYSLPKATFVLQSYDADTNTLEVILNGSSYYLAHVQPEVAKRLYSQKDALFVEVKVDFSEGSLGKFTELGFVDPPTERLSFPILVSGLTAENERDGLKYVWVPWTMMPKGFWLGQTEVTERAFLRVMALDDPDHPLTDFPKTRVSWAEANEYCSRVGGRLPTEAEWEWAALANTAAASHSKGPELLAWYSGNSDGKAHTVGRKEANAWGLYDMLGNVSEWVVDRYTLRLGSNEYRVVRGGSMFTPMTHVLPPYRGYNVAGLRSIDLGFRCVAVHGNR